jgi:hypothetical protein
MKLINEAEIKLKENETKIFYFISIIAFINLMNLFIIYDENSF